MTYSETFIKAFTLIFSLEPETASAIIATLFSSSLAMLICTLLGLPLGFLLGFYNFKAKRTVKALVNTLLSFPTVVTGLIVYMLLSNAGPLAALNLLFTVYGVSIGLAILGLPLIVSLTANAVETADSRLRLTILTLGANPTQTLFTYIWELRFNLTMVLIATFGRLISEVGIAMMVGGNIKWHTRTMTTAIALETGKGDFATALALGIVLLFIALIINIAISLLQLKDKEQIKI
ncbi:ABC transporter permease [Desulfovibrio litoralis]|uniref:Tungstate transport system permease protein n=1 Tax=Desulfovibrio litoralis DSM 11393 TaxID=1121455 RepID=A0A1M7S690_9BACT|nr:ABC transporter permease [Desulfovibrio litoralis]SHN53884.1 tungstate transport system permease protein [Desulfovibrio litoralis DSM 11393]